MQVSSWCQLSLFPPKNLSLDEDNLVKLGVQIDIIMIKLRIAFSRLRLLVLKIKKNQVNNLSLL